MLRFTKMEGAGNDYVYVDNRNQTVMNPEMLAQKISNRHFGVGSDGLVLIELSEKADARMRMFNSDGSESEMCGNASRCVARYVWERFGLNKSELTLETGAGIKTVQIHEIQGVFESATVNMGSPILTPAQIPIDAKTNKIVIGDTSFICVSMGNPHAVTFVEDVNTAQVLTQGPFFETHPIFPRRSNIEFVQIISRSHVKMRVWERGAGETLACGTGACAVAVACVLEGKTDRKVQVELPGGILLIEWEETENQVLMTGPAVFVFEGEWIER